MFVFKFEGALFRFSAKAPALEVLFQLPPRLKASKKTSSLPPSAGSNLVRQLADNETALHTLVATFDPSAEHFADFIYFSGGKLILLDAKKL